MKKFYAAAALAAMMFSACSTVEPVNPIPEKATLNFGSVVTANVVTRVDPQLEDSFKFNLAAEGVYAAVEGEEVTYVAGTGYSYTNKVVIFANAPRNLTAWAPISETPEAGTPNIFKLTPGASATDFLYQSTKAINSTEAGNVTLTMKHAMAKLTFVVEFPAGHDSPKKISSLKVAGTPGESTIDIATGTWTPGADAEITVVSAEQGTSVAMTALVVPVTTLVADALKVTCTINGATYTDIAVKGITSLVESTNYEVKLKVQGTGLAISGVSVSEWVTGDNGTADL